MMGSKLGFWGPDLSAHLLPSLQMHAVFYDTRCSFLKT